MLATGGLTTYRLHLAKHDGFTEVVSADLTFVQLASGLASAPVLPFQLKCMSTFHAAARY